MSHYTVTVLLCGDVTDVNEALIAALDPFDENKAVMEVTEGDETYWSNPNAKWDWWSIGGRWKGFYIPAPGADPAKLIAGSPGAFGNASDPGKVDGGPRKLLDFEATRTHARDDAETRWNEYAVIIDGTPVAEPWSAFLAKTKGDGAVLTIDAARAAYAAQPRVKAIAESALGPWSEAHDEIDPYTREEYADRVANAALTSYALLDLDGQWHEPGRMGWFGVSDATDESRAAFETKFNKALDAIDGDTIVVLIDAHI